MRLGNVIEVNSEDSVIPGKVYKVVSECSDDLFIYVVKQSSEFTEPVICKFDIEDKSSPVSTSLPKLIESKSKLREVEDFNEFKEYIFSKGYITYEKLDQLNYVDPQVMFIDRLELEYFPLIVCIELNSGERLFRFIKSYSDNLIGIIKYNIDGTTEVEDIDIKMIHIILDTNRYLDLIPKMFSHYNNGHLFRNEYIAYDISKDLYINKYNMYGGEFVMGANKGTVHKFLYNRDNISLLGVPYKFLEWDGSKHTLNRVIGYDQFESITNESGDTKFPVYDVKSNKYINVTSLKKGDTIKFITNTPWNEVVVVDLMSDHSGVDESCDPEINTSLGLYKLNYMENIIKLR